MKPQIDFGNGDILIKRAVNGWAVYTESNYQLSLLSDNEEDAAVLHVYEDTETEWGDHEALISLFREHFSDFVQSKKRGGVKLEVRETGYSDEEDGGEFTDVAPDANTYTMAMCDVCGRVVDEYEIISCSNLAGVVMCAGAMKDSCKARLHQGSESKKFLNPGATPDNVSEEDDEG